jgi:hypothetical protein
LSWVIARDDLEQIVLLGGNATFEAKNLLAAEGIDAVWRSFQVGNYAEAARLAETLLRDGASDPAIHYFLGLSLHSADISLQKALAHYAAALDRGFDPGWTLFHRGRLKLELAARSRSSPTSPIASVAFPLTPNSTVSATSSSAPSAV